METSFIIFLYNNSINIYIWFLYFSIIRYIRQGTEIDLTKIFQAKFSPEILIHLLLALTLWPIIVLGLFMVISLSMVIQENIWNNVIVFGRSIHLELRNFML